MIRSLRSILGSLPFGEKKWSPSLSILSGESAWGSVQKPLLTAVRRAGWQRCNGHRVTANEREQPCAANQQRGRLTTRVWVRTQMQAGRGPATESRHRQQSTDSSPRSRCLLLFLPRPAPQQAWQPFCFFLFAAAAAWCRWAGRPPRDGGALVNVTPSL